MKNTLIVILLMFAGACTAQVLSVRIPMLGVGTSYVALRTDEGFHSLERTVNSPYLGASLKWPRKVRLSIDYFREVWHLKPLSETKTAELTGVVLTDNGFPEKFSFPRSPNIAKNFCFSFLMQKTWDIGSFDLNLGTGMKYYHAGSSGGSAPLHLVEEKLYRVISSFTYNRVVPYLGVDLIANYKSRVDLRLSGHVSRYLLKDATLRFQRISGLAASEEFEFSETGWDVRLGYGLSVYYQVTR